MKLSYLLIVSNYKCSSVISCRRLLSHSYTTPELKYATPELKYTNPELKYTTPELKYTVPELKFQPFQLCNCNFTPCTVDSIFTVHLESISSVRPFHKCLIY